MDDLEARLNMLRFSLVQTGGGCTAYQSKNGSIIITKYGDAEAPDREREIVTVGVTEGQFSCPLGLILNGTITFEEV